MLLPTKTSMAEPKIHNIMNVKYFIASCLIILCVATASAQNPTLPKQVKNLTVLSLDGKAATLPHFGEKNLLIFYVDPDKYKQNAAFTEELEANKKAASDNIYGFGVMNLADAPLIPNRLARALAQRRTAKNGATILADQTHTMRDAWGLGDCNNLFVLMIVNMDGELVYCHKGELSRDDINHFYDVIAQYR